MTGFNVQGSTFTASKSPLVLVPGIQGRWEYMQPAVDALAAHFDVITFSLRGERPGDYVEQIRVALDQRHVDRAVICGVSFGGVVALRFAAAHPGRTKALVLASTPGPDWHPQGRHAVYALWPRICGPLFVAETPWRLRREIAVALPSSSARWTFRLGVLRTALSAPISFSAMAARARLTDRVDARADCARITAPTLVVNGESALDRIVPVAGSAEYARLIPGARLTTIERTGHLGSVTRPEEFARVIAEFVATTAGANAAA